MCISIITPRCVYVTEQCLGWLWISWGSHHLWNVNTDEISQLFDVCWWHPTSFTFIQRLCEEKKSFWFFLMWSSTTYANFGKV